MTESQQIHDDLAFVRNAVQRQQRTASPSAILWLWAIYVLIGYTLLDFNDRAGGLFLAIAGVICGLLSWILGAAAARRAGEADRATGQMEMLHWMSIFIGILAVVALAAIHPALRGMVGGQMIVIVVGMAYFLYGVHRDRHFLWLGPVLMAGAVAISFVPKYPWTLLGIVIAAGLVIPTFFRRQTNAS